MPSLLFGKAGVAGAAVAAVAAAALLAFGTTAHRDLDWDGFVLPMAKRWFYGSSASASADEKAPLRDVNVLITGATSGLGLSLAKAMSKLGATVVAIGRSPSKLASLEAEIGGGGGGGGRAVYTFRADFSDLDSVAAAADEIARDGRITKIDVMVNNAGMHAGYELRPMLGILDYNYSTPQGYDRTFAVNYLSHFLLTEKLAGLVANSTAKSPSIVQISSSFHWGADGSDLRRRRRGQKPGDEGSDLPVAARPGGSRGFYVFRTQRSYANSKLAQIYHARALRRRHPLLSPPSSSPPPPRGVRVVSVCPAWVGTNIAGGEGTLMHTVMGALGYPVEGWGLASTLNAIFDTTTVGSDFYTNTRFFDYVTGLLDYLPSWSYEWGLRDALVYGIAMTALAVQRFAAETYPTSSSPESYDVATADELYDWSYEAVKGYL